jgi:hypothetical protein
VKLEDPPIPDEILFHAIQNGLEAAGLSEVHAAYVYSVRNELLSDPAMWEGLFGPMLSLDQQQEIDRAAYLAAEQVVHQAEMAEAAAIAAAHEVNQVCMYLRLCTSADKNLQQVTIMPLPFFHSCNAFAKK